MLKANKNLITTAIIGAIATTLLFTVQTSNAKDKHGSPERKVAKQFKRLDSNDDRILDLSELLIPALNKAEKKFTRRDADEDGLLTFEEATKGKGGKHDLSEIAEEIVQCVADIKAETGNRFILELSAENFQTQREKFDNADTSGDELLDLDEVLAEKTRRVTVAFNKMDKNDTDTVSLREYIIYKKQQFATRRAVRSCVDELTDDEEF